ncbi:hypothetical protein APHAL10511_008254 [Amanita phalloides]|nr:hypothetical protein APHAL10511_008254 [Amanita phalloides]
MEGDAIRLGAWQIDPAASFYAEPRGTGLLPLCPLTLTVFVIGGLGFGFIMRNDGDYAETIGAMLLGVLFNTYLFGLVSYQFITYYSSGCRDPLWIRAMVFTMLMVDIAHSLSLIYMSWLYCVKDFGNPAGLVYADWVYSVTPVATAVTAVMTHFFLGYRIYRLTLSKLLYGFIIIMSVAVFAAGLATSVRALQLRLFIQFNALDHFATSWVSLQSTLDLFIAGILAAKLYVSRTRFKQTNTVIHRLIRAAVQTGTFATMFAVADLVAFLMGQNHISGMFTYPIGRIYTNTIMDTLNMRDALRNVLDEPRTVSIVVQTGSTGMQVSDLSEAVSIGMPESVVVKGGESVSSSTLDSGHDR